MKTAIKAILLSIIFSSSFFMFSGECAPEDMDLGFFLKRLCSEDSWLYPIPGERAFMASSNQPVNMNDCNAFLRKEQSVHGPVWNVLVDLEGPGVITRFWTAGDFDGELEIIIDSLLVVKTTLRDFFGGKVEGFPRPLVLNDKESSGGRVSYIPLPFGKSIRIRSNSKSESFYWQVNYSLFYGNETVKSFTGDISPEDSNAIAKAVSLFTACRVQMDSRVQKQEFTTDLLPGKTVTQSFPGKGIVRSFRITMPGDFWKFAGNILLTVNCDNEITPSIETGLLNVAHLSSKLNNYQSLYSSFDGRTLSFDMPIPFGDGIKISLTNGASHIFQGGKIEIIIDNNSSSDMRLHVKSHIEQPEFGKLLTLENIHGEGVFAGLNIIEQAPVSIGEVFSYQEGNEYITLDEGTSTVWRGTGTADYFNCGYCFRDGEVFLPLSGCLDKREIDGGRISAYRIHKLDAVPFRNGLLFSIEPGCPKKGSDKVGRLHIDYRWTTFWYSK